ncbi:uncharacterized protein SPSK_01422 [Sporothrix schenckii 1099-18]|uniref:Uncharacterized protein n=1 Tax=Sporothrix schenckii 1099-18 TaxID=1397361 RepID=A0A0F2MBV8_SPOSC|nr:uncharacterized protein SPSK_01422 [Sporothrix schenckii 1099-18]KJR87188.1 hypothetical protein SPSK_01422 [Sporothrix schenckii 1099-18]
MQHYKRGWCGRPGRRFRRRLGPGVGLGDGGATDNTRHRRRELRTQWRDGAAQVQAVALVAAGGADGRGDAGRRRLAALAALAQVAAVLLAEIRDARLAGHRARGCWCGGWPWCLLRRFLGRLLERCLWRLLGWKPWCLAERGRVGAGKHGRLLLRCGTKRRGAAVLGGLAARDQGALELGRRRGHAVVGGAAPQHAAAAVGVRRDGPKIGRPGQLGAVLGVGNQFGNVRVVGLNGGRASASTSGSRATHRARRQSRVTGAAARMLRGQMGGLQLLHLGRQGRAAAVLAAVALDAPAVGGAAVRVVVRGRGRGRGGVLDARLGAQPREDKVAARVVGGLALGAGLAAAAHGAGAAAGATAGAAAVHEDAPAAVQQNADDRGRQHNEAANDADERRHKRGRRQLGGGVGGGKDGLEPRVGPAARRGRRRRGGPALAAAANHADDGVRHAVRGPLGGRVAGHPGRRRQVEQLHDAAAQAARGRAGLGRVAADDQHLVRVGREALVAGAGVRGGVAARVDLGPGEGGQRQHPDVVVEVAADAEAVEAAVVVDVEARGVGRGGDDGAGARALAEAGAARRRLLVPFLAGDVVDVQGGQERGAGGAAGGRVVGLAGDGDPLRVDDAANGHEDALRADGHPHELRVGAAAHGGRQRAVGPRLGVLRGHVDGDERVGDVDGGEAVDARHGVDGPPRRAAQAGKVPRLVLRGRAGGAAVGHVARHVGRQVDVQKPGPKLPFRAVPVGLVQLRGVAGRLAVLRRVLEQPAVQEPLVVVGEHGAVNVVGRNVVGVGARRHLVEHAHVGREVVLDGKRHAKVERVHDAQRILVRRHGAVRAVVHARNPHHAAAVEIQRVAHNGRPRLFPVAHGGVDLPGDPAGRLGRGRRDETGRGEERGGLHVRAMCDTEKGGTWL